MPRPRKDSIFKNASTHKTIALLRQSDKVMDGIRPPSIWTRVKRELLYVFAIVWVGPAIALIWLGIAMLLFSIVF